MNDLGRNRAALRGVDAMPGTEHARRRVSALDKPAPPDAFGVVGHRAGDPVARTNGTMVVR